MKEKQIIEHKLGKLSYKYISQDIVDELMADILRGNTSFSNRTIIKIVRAFTYNILKSIGYDHMDVSVVPSSIIKLNTKINDTLGIVVGNRLLLDINHVLELKKGNIEVITTIFHECRHVYQKQLIENIDINYDAYRLIAEEVIRDAYNENYYYDNYDHLFLEVDAEIESTVATYRYLKRVTPELAEDMIEDAREYIKGCSSDLKVCGRVLEDKKIERDALLDSIMVLYPEYAYDYPLLSLYYKEDGTKVTCAEIISRGLPSEQSNEDGELRDKICHLDSIILKHRSGTKENLLNDLVSLYDYEFIKKIVCNHETMDLRQKIIDHLILSLLTINDPYPVVYLLDLIDQLIGDLQDNIVKNKNEKTIIMGFFMFKEFNPIHKYIGQFYINRKKE